MAETLVQVEVEMMSKFWQRLKASNKAKNMAFIFEFEDINI